MNKFVCAITARLIFLLPLPSCALLDRNFCDSIRKNEVITLEVTDRFEPSSDFGPGCGSNFGPQVGDIIELTAKKGRQLEDCWAWSGPLSSTEVVDYDWEKKGYPTSWASAATFVGEYFVDDGSCKGIRRIELYSNFEQAGIGKDEVVVVMTSANAKGTGSCPQDECYIHYSAQGSIAGKD